MDKNQIDNLYIDLNELFKDFTKYLEIYDLNLLSIYINNTDKDKLQFSQKMFLNLKNKINSLKYLNANNRKLFQDRIDNISNYLNNNSLNFVNENLIIRNQRKNSKNYGIFLQEKGKNCSSCFKMANDETSDAEIISLNFFFGLFYVLRKLFDLSYFLIVIDNICFSKKLNYQLFRIFHLLGISGVR